MTHFQEILSGVALLVVCTLIACLVDISIQPKGRFEGAGE